jgi:hypothetical protein
LIVVGQHSQPLLRASLALSYTAACWAGAPTTCVSRERARFSVCEPAASRGASQLPREGKPVAGCVSRCGPGSPAPPPIPASSPPPKHDCEHNDQVHSPVNLLAAKAGPGAETRRLASTTNPRWLLRSTASGCGWRRGHGAITTNLFTRACPSSTPAPPTPLSKRTCGVLTNAKSARAQPRPVLHLRCARGQGWGAGTATRDAGGLPHGSSYFLGQPWLRPRDPKDAGGVARQRRCPVKYKPPPPRNMTARARRY